MLIPALFCGSWEWNGQFERLARTHTMYAVTLPGSDGRPARPSEISMAGAARDLHELIVARKLGRSIVIGHSLGGTLAALFGETYPADTAGVVAVEGGYPIAPAAAERQRRVAATVHPSVGVSQRAFGAVFRERMLRYVITRPTDVDARSSLRIQRRVVRRRVVDGTDPV